MAAPESLTALYSLTGEMPHRIHLEIFTFLDLIGEVTGKRVLDAACGHGLYSRVLKRRGAARVVGVDLSEPLLQVARDIEKKLPLGIEYLCADITSALDIEAIDLATAVWLFPFADTPERLEAMASGLYRTLVPGGMLAGVTSSTALAPDLSAYEKYGLTAHAPAAPGDADVYTVDIHSNPPFSFSARFWTAPTLERALSAAGFREVTWGPPRCSPEGMAELGADYWATMLEYPLMRFFTCRK
jgi:SAM-dependent methyltransferase